MDFFGNLNSVTVRDLFRMPTAMALINEAGNVTFLRKLDITKCHWPISLEKEFLALVSLHPIHFSQ